MLGVGVRRSPRFWGSRARVARRAQPKGEVYPHLAVQGVQGEAGLPPRRPHPGEGIEEAVHLPPVGVLHDGGHGVASGLAILVPVISEDKIPGGGAAVGHVLSQSIILWLSISFCVGNQVLCTVQYIVQYAVQCTVRCSVQCTLGREVSSP